MSGESNLGDYIVATKKLRDDIQRIKTKEQNPKKMTTVKQGEKSTKEETRENGR